MIDLGQYPIEWQRRLLEDLHLEASNMTMAEVVSLMMLAMHEDELRERIDTISATTPVDIRRLH